MVVTYAVLWWLLRALVGMTARRKRSATRTTTSWSVIGNRIAGQSGEEGGPERNEPSPSRIPASQYRVIAVIRRERGVVSMALSVGRYGACVVLDESRHYLGRPKS